MLICEKFKYFLLKKCVKLLSFFSSAGRSPERAIVLPPASALALASASAAASASAVAKSLTLKFFM